MPDSTADTVLAILRHIERCQRRTGAGPGPKDYRENGRLVARIVRTRDDGVTELQAATKGHAWRLSVFGKAWRLRVEVRVGELEGE